MHLQTLSNGPYTLDALLPKALGGGCRGVPLQHRTSIKCKKNSTLTLLSPKGAFIRRLFVFAALQTRMPDDVLALAIHPGGTALVAALYGEVAMYHILRGSLQKVRFYENVHTSDLGLHELDLLMRTPVDACFGCIAGGNAAVLKRVMVQKRFKWI